MLRMLPEVIRACNSYTQRVDLKLVPLSGAFLCGTLRGGATERDEPREPIAAAHLCQVLRKPQSSAVALFCACPQRATSIVKIPQPSSTDRFSMCLIQSLKKISERSG